MRVALSGDAARTASPAPKATLARTLMHHLAEDFSESEWRGMLKTFYESSMSDAPRSMAERVFAPLIDFLAEPVGQDSNMLYVPSPKPNPLPASRACPRLDRKSGGRAWMGLSLGLDRRICPQPGYGRGIVGARG